jgi:transcriptional regulator with XRE-family HTH domain
MKRNQKSAILSPPQLVLKKLGGYLKDARKGRGLTGILAAERAGISRPTLVRVEAGDPSVSMGAYAALLQLYGLLEQMAAGITPEQDKTGQVLRMTKQPKRVRSPSKKEIMRYDF